MKMLPDVSPQMQLGSFIVAEEAGPPSPVDESDPSPTIVSIAQVEVVILRTRRLPWSVM